MSGELKWPSFWWYTRSQLCCINQSCSFPSPLIFEWPSWPGKEWRDSLKNEAVLWRLSIDLSKVILVLFLPAYFISNLGLWMVHFAALQESAEIFPAHNTLLSHLARMWTEHLFLLAGNLTSKPSWAARVLYLFVLLLKNKIKALQHGRANTDADLLQSRFQQSHKEDSKQILQKDFHPTKQIPYFRNQMFLRRSWNHQLMTRFLHSVHLFLYGKRRKELDIKPWGPEVALNCPSTI